MKNTLAIFSLIAAALLLAGCAGEPEAADGAELNTEGTGGGYKHTVTTDEGTTTIEGTITGDDWCQAGSSWQTTHTGEGAGTSEMVIVGIVGSGKYAGYCHVTYDIDSEGTQAKIDYYFDEEGNGYQVMDINGQHIESEWQA